MHIAIKCPAPIGPNLTKWGDYPFAQALARALEARGAKATIHFWPEWDRREGEDAVLVLRGKRRYAPAPDTLSAMWVMSHPATVSVEEIDAYTQVYVASKTHARLLEGATAAPVAIMRQCTDTNLFARRPAQTDDISDRRDIIFVANSRGVRRDIVQLAVEAGAPFKIIGRHWRNTGLGKLVAQEFVDNDALPALYRASRLSLNDHWGDMIHFGYINNRIFDCLACGLPLLTDVFPELREVCGDGLLYASDRTSFQAALQHYQFAYPEVKGRADALWQRLRDDFSFDRRAAQILAGFEQPRRAAQRAPASPAAPPAAVLVEAMMREAPPRAPLQFLHVNPSAAATYPLSAREDISYLSAGYGLGPWHVALPADAAPLIENVFDAILVERTDLLDAMSAADRRTFLAAIARRAKPGGWIAAPDLLNSAEFSECRERRVDNAPAGWRVFTRS